MEALKLKYLDWYAPNVGLIKTEVWERGLFGRKVGNVELQTFRCTGWDYRRKSLRRHCFWPRRKAVTSAASICPSTVAWCRSDSFLSLIPEPSETNFVTPRRT